MLHADACLLQSCCLRLGDATLVPLSSDTPLLSPLCFRPIFCGILPQSSTQFELVCFKTPLTRLSPPLADPLFLSRPRVGSKRNEAGLSLRRHWHNSAHNPCTATSSATAAHNKISLFTAPQNPRFPPPHVGTDRAQTRIIFMGSAGITNDGRRRSLSHLVMFIYVLTPASTPPNLVTIQHNQ